MPFQPPEQPNLLPLLLQHTLNQRAQEEARKYKEQEAAKQRAETALNYGIEASRLGIPVKDSLPFLRSQGLNAEAEPFLVGYEKAFKQKQKQQLEQARIPDAAQGIASTLANIQAGAAHPNSLTTELMNLQGSFTPESISQITSEGQSRFATDLASIREKRPVPFYNVKTGQFYAQARPGTPEYERLNKNQNLSVFEPQGTPEQVFGVDKEGKRKARQALATQIGNIRQTSAMIRKIDAADPRSFGARSILGAKLGGIVAQIDPLDPTLGDQVSQSIAGASLADLKSIDVQQTMSAASAVEAFVGATGGKVTDRDLIISREALGSGSASATKEQARKAMESVLILQSATAELYLMQGGQKPRFDLLRRGRNGDLVDNDREMKRLANFGRTHGLSDEGIERLIEQHQEQQRDAMEAGLY